MAHEKYDGHFMQFLTGAVDKAFANLPHKSWPCMSDFPPDHKHCAMDACNCGCHGLKPGTPEWTSAHEVHLHGNLRGE